MAGVNVYIVSPSSDPSGETVRIVLISCVSKKRSDSAKAKDLYTSPLFKGAYKYAEKLGADQIFILSAKHGLLEEDDIIEPYDETLNTKTQSEIKAWSRSVIEALADRTDTERDDFVFLAGERYRRYLVNAVKNSTIPLRGLSIGKQLAFYKENS